ncbi:MAG: response regulator [Bacteroidota bacterium]
MSKPATNTQPKVMIVDDEPHIVMAIEYLMQQQGYQTQTAHDGQDALKKLADFLPKVMILDVMMPNLDGFDVANAVRQDERYQDVLIIFLTARGTDRDKAQGYGSGGDVYLTKPFDNDRLVELVQEMLAYG